jgi:hypothetical protein
VEGLTCIKMRLRADTVDWHAVGHPSINLGNESLQLVPARIVEIEVWISVYEVSMCLTCNVYQYIAYH